jgi:hypothetical protein
MRTSTERATLPGKQNLGIEGLCSGLLASPLRIRIA